MFVKTKAPPEFLPMTLSFVYTLFFTNLTVLTDYSSPTGHIISALSPPGCNPRYSAHHRPSHTDRQAEADLEDGF